MIIIVTIIVIAIVIVIVARTNPAGGSGQDAPLVLYRPVSSWIPFGDHPLKLERYRED